MKDGLPPFLSLPSRSGRAPLRIFLLLIELQSLGVHLLPGTSLTSLRDRLVLHHPHANRRLSPHNLLFHSVHRLLFLNPKMNSSRLLLKHQSRTMRMSPVDVCLLLSLLHHLALPILQYLHSHRRLRSCWHWNPLVAMLLLEGHSDLLVLPNRHPYHQPSLQSSILGMFHPQCHNSDKSTHLNLQLSLLRRRLWLQNLSRRQLLLCSKT